MDPQEQESQVVEFKKVGNSYFAKKKYKEAVGAYSDALDLFRSLSLEVLFSFFLFSFFFLFLFLFLFSFFFFLFSFFFFFEPFFHSTTRRLRGSQSLFY